MSSEQQSNLPADHIQETDFAQNPKEILEKVSKHIAAIDEKSVNYYLQNRVCGGPKPQLSCRPRYFLPEVTRITKKN